MKFQRFNWPLWSGFLLSVVAVLSYPLVFVWYPVTRDFPWATLLLFAVAAVLLFIGVRRAFASDRPRRARIIGAGVTLLSVTILVLFIFSFFIVGRRLPVSQSAPRVGQQVPDFSLADTNGRPVALAELLAAPINGQAPKGVMLVFYRGYW